MPAHDMDRARDSASASEKSARVRIDMRDSYTAVHANVCRSVYQDEPRIYVQSEEEPDQVLLETKISKDEGYQKQQGSLVAILSTQGRR